MSALRAQVLLTLFLLGACNSERSASDEPSVQAVKVQTASSVARQRVLSWGYRDGDQRNAFYPDYPTMQRMLEAGYRTYAKAIRSGGHDVIMAPVGLAFARVYEDGPSAKVPFASLYEPDGSHR